MTGITYYHHIHDDVGSSAMNERTDVSSRLPLGRDVIMGAKALLLCEVRRREWRRRAEAVFERIPGGNPDAIFISKCGHNSRLGCYNSEGRGSPFFLLFFSRSLNWRPAPAARASGRNKRRAFPLSPLVILVGDAAFIQKRGFILDI